MNFFRTCHPHGHAKATDREGLSAKSKWFPKRNMEVRGRGSAGPKS